MTLDTIGLHLEGGKQFAQTTGGMVQVDILSITISNLKTVPWHFFFEKVN